MKPRVSLAVFFTIFLFFLFPVLAPQSPIVHALKRPNRHPRHFAPAVSYPLVLPRCVRWACVAYMVIGAMGLGVWGIFGAGTGPSVQAWPVHAGAWALWLAIALVALWELRAHPRGALHFHQGRWHWRDHTATDGQLGQIGQKHPVTPTASALANPYISIDFQALMLVRFDCVNTAASRSRLTRWLLPRPVVYVWLTRQSAPDAWPALRRALWQQRQQR